MGEPAVVSGKSLYFRGKRILGATMAQLNHRQGMLGASDIVWSGSSAGALATIYHADWLGKRLGPKVETYRAIPFSGLVFLSNSVYDAWTVQNADNISKNTVR